MIKHRNRIIYSVLIVFQMLVCLYFANQKQSFYCDEPWSYGLANSRDYAFIGRLETLKVSEDGWVTQDFYNNFVNVDKDNPFSFYPAYHNQELDVHPPFYYFLLHIASLFTDHLSKWPGIILNLIILLAFDFVFFYVAKSVFRDRVQSLLALALFSFTAAGLSCILYTRMYFLLTFLILCYWAIHVHIIKNNSISRKDLLLLFLCVVCGGLTHYYFYIFAFFISLMFGISLLWRKRIYDAFWYGSALLGGFLFNINFFPATVVHVFLRNRGTEVLDRIGDGKTFWMYLYVTWVDQYMHAEYLHIIIFALLVAAVYRIAAAKQRKEAFEKFIEEKPYLSKSNILIAFMIYILITTSLTIVRISWWVHRFVMPAYPFIAILTIFLLNSTYKLANIKQQARNLITAFIVCSFSVLSIGKQHIDFLYPEYPDAVEALKETKGYDILIYYTDRTQEEYYTSFEVRMIYDEYILFDENDFRYLKDYLDHRKTKDPFVIAMPRFLSNKHELLGKIYDALELEGSYDLVHFYRSYDYFVIR